MEINVTPIRNEIVDDNGANGMISDHDLIGQTFKLYENEEKRQEILLRESVQLDIKQKAKEMADKLWSQKESKEVQELMTKL